MRLHVYMSIANRLYQLIKFMLLSVYNWSTADWQGHTLVCKFVYCSNTSCSKFQEQRKNPSLFLLLTFLLSLLYSARATLFAWRRCESPYLSKQEVGVGVFFCLPPLPTHKKRQRLMGWCRPAAPVSHFLEIRGTNYSVYWERQLATTYQYPHIQTINALR